MTLPPSTQEFSEPSREETPVEVVWRKSGLPLQWCFILFTWYSLSIGPVFWIWHQESVERGPTFIEVVYFPLLLVCHLIPPFGAAINRYIEWWNF